ncbi:hypothetical protein FJZ23_01925 [Candidatus Parcubacteria bacterium]|nr:hypothetical protein [Candidatus Parcubacteria bacterium]
MTNSIAKRALTSAVAAATILWSVGFAALAPQTASAASYGDLIKGTTLSTVYYYGSDGQRYSFPNEKTFFSWYNDFSGVVTMSDAELANITLAGNIVYRPGARWIKITSDEKTYAVAKNGSVHWIESEAVAKGLAGDDWNQFIDDVPDVFFVDYSVGDSLTSAASAYEGALVKSGSDTYLVWGGKKNMVTADGMMANRFKSGLVLDGSGVNLGGLTAGSAIGAKLAYLADSAQKVTTSEVISSKDVSVSLAGSPAASTLIAGQGVADLAHVTLTNNSGSEVKLNKLSLTRTGVSADTTLSNLYLFKGYVRLSDSATISDGKATFNDSTGLVSLPAGSSTTLIVRSDIAANTNGQTVGLKLAAAADMTFSNGGAASGSFPLEGATHTIAASPATFGAASFGTANTTTPAANNALDPSEGVRLWERTLAVSNNELWLKAIRFRNIGSIDDTDVKNWQLYIGGVMRGSAVAQEDEDGYVTFDMSGSPIELKTGNHTVKIQADVVGGSSRTVQAGLRNSADFVAVDSDYGQPVRPTGGAATGFAAMDAGLQTIATGSVTFTKTGDSPSGEVVETASNIVLGRWTVKAFGEKMKIETLRVAFTESDGEDVTLRNGAVYLDGAQIGSTAGLEANAGAGTDYTEYTFGSSFVVMPGTPRTVEIRADIFDSDGTDNIENADTVRAELSDMTATSNVQRMTSGSYTSSPTSAVIANTLSVNAGTAALTVARNNAYASQTTVDPKTNYKIGSFTVTAGTAEGVNLTDINVDLDTDTSAATTDLFNLYLKYGPSNNLTTTSTKGSVAETGNSWSINYALKAGETIYVDVYADIDSAISAAETVIAVVDVNGTTMLSSVAPTTAEVSGQTVTIGTGDMSIFNDDHPVSAVIYDNQEVTVAKYRVSASNESFTIKELKTSVGSAAAAGAISEVRLYDGSSMLASTVLDEADDTNATAGTAGTFTGLNIAVASNASKTLTLKYALAVVGPGGATSQTDLRNELERIKAADSNGVETTRANTVAADDSNAPDAVTWADASVIGNNQFVFASIPTLNHVDLTNSTLVNGQATDLYKFSVASSGGSLSVKQFKLTVAWTDGGTADTLEVESLKLYKNGADITSSVTMVDEDGNSVTGTNGLLESDEDLVVTWTTEDTISEGETVTYTVRGTPQGFRLTGADTVGDSVSLFLAQDSATNGTSVFINDETDQAAGQSEIMELFTSAAANVSDGTAAEFIWSDLSVAAHASAANASSTGDWHNGFLVRNLDLTGETWTK